MVRFFYHNFQSELEKQNKVQNLQVRDPLLSDSVGQASTSAG